MQQLFLFLALVFSLTFIFGLLLEKIRVPWIFSALLIGNLLVFYNPFYMVTSSQAFTFLAELGMYFLLFIIGFEIDLTKMKKAGKFILKSTFFIIFLEAFFGTIIIHFVLGYELFISFIVALSFATVGEEILIPILDEFKIINTKLGQSIIGIGILDDVLEVLILIVVIFVVGTSSYAPINIGFTILALFLLFALTFGLTKLEKTGKRFNFLDIEILFLFVLFVFFLFLGIGAYAHAIPIAAFLAGIALKTFVPEKRLQKIESEIKTMCYGFFAPIFFIGIGLSIDINYVLAFPFLLLLVILTSNGAKLLGSYLVARKELGLKNSILLGIGLSARFSTSIIVIKILFENNIIDNKLYSIIIASSIIFTFVVPILLSTLLARWKIPRSQTPAKLP